MDYGWGQHGAVYLAAALAVLAVPVASATTSPISPASTPTTAAGATVAVVEQAVLAPTPVTFELSPDLWNLWNGDEETAVAVAVAPTCTAKRVALLPLDADDAAASVSHSPSQDRVDQSAAACRVEMKAEFPLASAASGWIVPESASGVTKAESLVGYTVARSSPFMSYVLLIFLTAVVTLLGAWWVKRHNKQSTATLERHLGSAAPMLTAVTAAGTSLLSIGAVATEFVPGYRLGGLAAMAALIAGAAAMAKLLSQNEKTRGAAAFISVGALVATVLINPFLLLHGTMGDTSRLLTMLGFAVLIAGIFEWARRAPTIEPAALETVIPGPVRISGNIEVAGGIQHRAP